jgi:hypothetical protein
VNCSNGDPATAQLTIAQTAKATAAGSPTSRPSPSTVALRRAPRGVRTALTAITMTVAAAAATIASNRAR